MLTFYDKIISFYQIREHVICVCIIENKYFDKQQTHVGNIVHFKSEAFSNIEEKFLVKTVFVGSCPRGFYS